MWGAISGIANIVGVAFAPGFYPSWYYLLVAVGYGLLLPLLAILQVRHATVRQSGAILGTAAGMATITVGIGASASADLVVGALFVRGIWWWTVGKMWAETDVLPRTLGVATMALAVIALGTAVATGPLDIDLASLWMVERVVLGLWTLAVSIVLWRARTAR